MQQGSPGTGRSFSRWSVASRFRNIWFGQSHIQHRIEVEEGILKYDVQSVGSLDETMILDDVWMLDRQKGQCLTFVSLHLETVLVAILHPGFSTSQSQAA